MSIEIDDSDDRPRKSSRFLDRDALVDQLVEAGEDSSDGIELPEKAGGKRKRKTTPKKQGVTPVSQSKLFTAKGKAVALQLYLSHLGEAQVHY
jgi:hypothetical protein